MFENKKYKSWCHCQWSHKLSKPYYSPTFSGPSLVLCKFPNYQSRVSELSLTQVSYFCGYPHHGLDPFAHIISPPSLRLVSDSYP